MGRTRRTAGLVFLVTFVIYLFPFGYNLFYKPFFTVGPAIDVVPNALLPVAILERGDFNLDQFSAFINATFRDAYFAARRNGHLVSRYPVTAAVLALPFYGIPLGSGWLMNPGLDWMSYPRSALFIARFPAAFITALAVLMFFFCARELTNLETSRTLALIFAFGTSVWTTASQALWQHTVGLLLLLIGLWFWLQGEGAEARSMAPGAFFLAAAVAARANNIFAALAVTGYVLLKERRAIVAWIEWAIPPVLLIVWYNWLYNGSPVVFGYQEGLAQSLSFIRIDGLVGLFISPSRGLLVYSPFIVFAALTFKDRTIIRRPIYLLAAAIFTLNVFLMSTFMNWDGGWGYGTRLLLEALPFAMLLLIPVAERLNAPARVTFFGLVAYSVGVQLLGLWDYGEHWHWHWDDWKYNVWDIAENEPLFYLRQYVDMMVQFLNRIRS